MDNSSDQSRAANAIRQKLQQALGLHRRGALADAKEIYQDILKQRPDDFDALFLLGVIACQTNNPRQGEELFGKAIRINPDVAEAYNNRGNALKDLGRPDEAIADYDKAISLRPDYAEAYNNRGIVFKDLNRLDEAIASYDKAISLKPDNAEAHNNRGIALRDVRRLDEAMVSFDRAISLRPNYAAAHYNRGNALQDVGRPEEALASYDKALALNHDDAAAHNNRGNALRDLQRLDEALVSYDNAISLKPDHTVAYNNRGNTFKDLMRFDEALASYDRAISIKPDYAEAHNNRGTLLKRINRLDQALASYAKAIALKPDFSEAHYNRGNALKDAKRLDEALASYDRALSLSPELVGAEGVRLHAKMQLCDWTNFETECANLVSSVRDGKTNTEPFAFLAVSSSPFDQLQCARLWVTKNFPSSQQPRRDGARYLHDKIRVGYVSADFREHPVAYLIAGMIEHHDRSRFDVRAISLGADDKSGIRAQLKESFEVFIDAGAYSDEQIAELVRSSELDILVDLMGFTTYSRTGIFAARPAPIQVNYLGYPGTMGASFIDYIIADETVIPAERKECYFESIAVLPNTYLANDSGRTISDKIFNRSDAGLPSEGIVFCCFNNNYKIQPRIFDRWMRILKQVDGSVLWLFEGNATAAKNLRREAAARGVNAERLVFAKRLPLLSEHLARHKLADLFLDTLPYNAHTTASDALWAGLPVLTCVGETFAGRVAASLLKAIELPELVTTTPEAYEQMAVRLATYPEQLAAIKRKLSEKRLTAPLFDTELFTRHIETAYTAMYQRHRAGLPCDDIFVAK